MIAAITGLSGLLKGRHEILFEQDLTQTDREGTGCNPKASYVISEAVPAIDQESSSRHSRCEPARPP